MPKSKPIPAGPPSDELVLAAIERAEHHHPLKDEPGVALSAIKEHLGMPHNGWTTRQLRPRLTQLETIGLVDTRRRHGRDLWHLTGKGKRLVAALRAAGALPALPESPQHQRWQKARTAASERIDGFREDARAALAEAIALLEAEEPPPSDAWFAMSHHLRHTCWRLGSATYCLTEWAEPDDAQLDIDPPTHGGGSRRNIWGWDSR